MLAPFSRAAAESENAATGVDAAVVEALVRDLDLTPEQVSDRIRSESIATELIPKLRQVMGDAYAGGWFDSTNLTAVVATTDPDQIELIEQKGAQAVLAKWNLQHLNDIVDRLDEAVPQLAQQQKQSIWSWGVDVKTNSVVVTIPADDDQAILDAQDFITLSLGDSKAIRIKRSIQGPPRLDHKLRGGDIYTNATDGGYCSVGFSVQGGYITAGHCSGGTTGDTVVGHNAVAQGTFLESDYPGADRAWVGVSSSWTPQPCVGTGSNRNCSASNNVVISGAAEAYIGSTVCRYGATTSGPHCGEIQFKNVSVNLGVNVVNNLTETTACAEEGDSGGPFVWNHQAQGTHSASLPNVNCPGSGTTWFYPVDLTLAAFNLTLVTGGSGTPAKPGSISVSPRRSNGSYSVSWPASSGATFYVLERQRYQGGFFHVYSGGGTVEGFYGETSGEYRHRVKACNASGCSSWRAGAFVTVCNPYCL